MGPRDLSPDDLRFVAEFVQCGKAAHAYAAVFPESKNSAVQGFRMMQRDEIRDQIKLTFKKIAQRRERAAEMTANASLLSLELADERLHEILSTRRLNQAEKLGREVKQIFLDGVTSKLDDTGKIAGFEIAPEVQEQLQAQGAAVEDSDLLKAIDLTLKRKGGIIKQEKAPAPTLVQNIIYRPAWRQAPKQIEGEVA
jgi:hypothetical protein